MSLTYINEFRCVVSLKRFDFFNYRYWVKEEQDHINSINIEVLE